MKAHWDNSGAVGEEWSLSGVPPGYGVYTAEERGGWAYSFYAPSRSNRSGIVADNAEDALRITADAARSWFSELGENDVAEMIP